jgi:tape measure domain-containing protein
MASQDAELQLKVSLDLAFFRQQLTGLGQSAAGYSVPIFIKFDRQTIVNEYRLLSRYIGGKDFRVKIQSNLEEEVNRAKTLAKAIGELRQTGQGQEGTLPIGIGGIASIKPKEARKIRTALRRSILSEGGKILIPTSIVAAITQVDVAAFKKAVTEKLSGIKVEVGVQTGKFSSTGTGAAGLHEYMRSQGMSGGNMPGAASVGRSERLRKALEEQTVNQLKELAKGQGLSGYSKLNKNPLINKLIAELGNDAAEALLGNIKMQMGNAGKSPIKRSFLDQIARAVLFMAGVDPSQLRAQPRKLPEVNWPTTAVPRQRPPIGPSSTGRLLGAAAGPAGLISGNTGPFGLLPKVTSKGSLEDAIRMISGKQADMGGPGALSLSSAAMGKRINAILTEYFKVVEIQVKETFDPGELNRSLNAFAYLVQSLRDAESRIKQARVAQSVDSLMQSIDAAVKTAQAKVRIVGTEVFDLGQRMQPTLPPSRTAGLLPAGVGRTPSSYATGATGGETQAQIFARREREARMRSDLRSMDVTGGAGRPASPYSRAYRGARPLTAMVPYAPGGAIVPTGGAGAPPSPPRPPSGGTGGGMGALGRALGNVQLPGAGLVREIGSEFAMAAKQVLLFGTAYKALAFLTSFPQQVGEAVGALQSFNNTLKAISPTAQEAATSNQFILDIVDRYNVPLQSARDGFTKLYASMAPAGFKGEEIRALFTGVSQAAATFGMSADKVDRVNYAFAQMASKGQVMSEELKGQLGDVLPGAMGIFAEAAGFKGPDAIQKFSKALEDGAYKGQAMRVLLKNVTTVLTKEFGPGAEGAARTFQGVINRMQNSTKLLYEAFEPVAIGFLNSVVVPMTGGLKTITEGFNAFFTGTQTKTAGGFAFARELEKLKPVFEGIRANVVAVLPTLQSFGGVLLEVSKVFLQIAGNPFVGYLARVYLNVLALTTVINILNLRALIPFIANLARSAFALVAFSAQMVGANQGLQLLNLTTRTAGATLRTFFATTGVGLVLVGIGLLIERFMSMNQKLEETRQKALGAADAIRNMSRTEARQSENQAAMDVKTLQRLQSRRNEGKTDIAITKEEEKALERTGTRIGRSVLGMRAVPGSAPEVMGYGEKVVDVSQVQAAILKRQGDLGTASRRIRDLQFQEQQSQAPTNLAPIPPDGGDASAAQKAAEKAQKAAEKLASQNQQLSIDAANRQNALNKTIFDSSIALSDQEYQHGIDLIDARNQYELSGLNSIAARQEKFQQDLQKIELQRIEIVRKAEQESAKASIEYRAAQNVATAAGSSGSDGTGKAIFGDTGRTFNAPGWVHGHFQNMDREALVKDTVEVVMGLLQQGSAAELSSGAPFKQGMSQSQVERLVRQGIGSHKQYASGASAIDVFVPKGTKVPTPLSGVGNLGGNAGVAGNLPRGSQLMHLDPRSASGGTMQRREAKAGGKLEVETQQVSSQQEQSRQAIIFATNKALEDRVTLIKSNLDTLFPVAEQKLENDLMIKRNQLQLQGMPQEYIDYQESAYKGAYEVNEAIKRYSESTVDLEKKKAALEARQAKGVALTTAETEALRNYTESIAQNDKAVADLEPKQRTMNILMLEGAIATMKNADALKAQQETMDLIKGSVESASNSYKGFLKEVATGGDPAEALQKFQEGLADQVLTIFLDYAFKPVEDFFKDSLSNLFNVPTEDEQRKKGQAALEAQLAHVKSIDTKVSAIANQTPQAGAATTTAAPTMGGQATLTSLSSSAMAFGGAGGEAISSALASTLESAQASIGLSMESLASSFEYGKDKLLEGVPPFEQALTVDLPGQVEKSTEALKAKGSTFSESLGKLTQGVGIAVGSIMGIAAGISQVKKGGTGNTLMGIGSVLASVGGAIGGFSKLSKAANGAVWTGGFQAFANGGTVKGPTLGLVGEGKYNEAIVPLPDGRSIPVQMRGGPGGESSRDLLAAQAQSRSSPSVLSMSFQSTTINGVEYVDRAQLEMAMAETRRVASRDGAARGANLAIDRLANSPSSRRRAGIR